MLTQLIGFGYSVKHKIVLFMVIGLVVYSILMSETFSYFLGYDRDFQSKSDTFGHRKVIEHKRRSLWSHGANGISIFHLPDFDETHLAPYYNLSRDGRWCFKEGTNWNLTLSASNKFSLNKSSSCVCLPTHFGVDCGIPAPVWYSQLLRQGKRLSDVNIQAVDKPRRIILSVIFYASTEQRNVEQLVTFLNHTFNSLTDVVDLFIVGEIKAPVKKQKPLIPVTRKNFVYELFPINSTKVQEVIISLNNSKHDNASMTNNKTSPSNLSDILKQDSFGRFRNQILHQEVLVNPRKYKDRSLRERLVLQYLWSRIFMQVTDFRVNDILIFMSPNIVPRREVIAFLKVYDNFPEPIKFIVADHDDDISVNFVDNRSKEKEEKMQKSEIASEEYYEYINANHAFNFAITFEYVSLLCRFNLNSYIESECTNNETYFKKFIDSFWPISYWQLGDPLHKVVDICKFCALEF